MHLPARAAGRNRRLTDAEPPRRPDTLSFPHNNAPDAPAQVTSQSHGTTTVGIFTCGHPQACRATKRLGDMERP